MMFWRQFIVFVGCYWLFNSIYFLIPDATYINVIYHYGVVMFCADLINVIAPQEQVAAVANHLISSHADLQIIRGCYSAGILFLMIAAVLAFQAKLSQKLLGLSMGTVLIYTLNTMRVCGLYYLIAYQHEWFEFVHLYLAPTLISIVAFIFFLWWAMGCRNNVNPGNSS
jgi:exosortase family protein XrtM